MWRLMYMSRARAGITEQDLLDILESARQHNLKNNVTGMLLYLEESFIQVLEGESGVIMETMTRIEKDPRHEGVVLLASEETDQRDFAEWSMGFAHVEQDEQTEGLFQLGRRSLAEHLPEDASWMVWHFMKGFYDMKRGIKKEEIIEE